jgi:hypothetical protein
MSDDVRVRPLTFDDLESIIALKGKVIKRPEFDPIVERNIYEWELRENPYKRDDFPIGFVLEHNSNIVGSVVLVPAKFKLAKENVYACFEIDLMVAQEFRFHGLKLLNKVWKENLFPLVVSTTPNNLSFEIEQKMGAIGILHTSFTYIYIISIKHVMSRIKHFRFEKFISLLNGSARSLLRAISKKIRKKEELIVEEITKFDNRFDEFFENASRDYDVLHIRDSRYLNWRYVGFPFGKRKIVSVLDKKNTLRGYIVIQKEVTKQGTKKANILDLFTKKSDINAIEELLLKSIEYAKVEKLDVIEIMPTNLDLKNILYIMGFIRRENMFSFCSFKCKNAEVSAIINKKNVWFLSSGDGDNAVYSAISQGF